MKKIIVLKVLLMALLFQSCSNNDENDGLLACTLELRIEVIKVKGKKLTKFYTIRKLNNNTIEIPKSFGYSSDSYPIMYDRKIPEFIDRTEEFNFIGEIDGTIVINESFIIKSDKCGHIEKINGIDEISL